MLETFKVEISQKNENIKKIKKRLPKKSLKMIEKMDLNSLKMSSVVKEGIKTS